MSAQRLEDTTADSRVRVLRVLGGRPLVHRLAALGVVPGAELIVVRPRNPALIAIGGARLAVGHSAAQAVEVEVVSE